MAEIYDLGQKHEFFDTIADRIWRAFWQQSGALITDVERALDETTAGNIFPFTLVAAEDRRFLGTVTGIQSDIAARPDIGPCIAALWVEPEARGSKLGRTLVKSAIERLRESGLREVYLPAKRPLRPYYLGDSWVLIEERIGEDQLDVFRRTIEPSA